MLAATLDLVAATADDVGSPIAGLVDAARVAVAATADETILLATTREVFAGPPEPRYRLEVADAGHLCLIGAEQGGLVGIVETVGLAIPPDLLALASDGCGADDPPVVDAFPAVDATTVAFLRAQLDGDAAADALLVDGPVDVGAAEATLTADA